MAKSSTTGRLAALVPALLLLSTPRILRAQLLGSEWEERARIAQVLGSAGASGSLLRSWSTAITGSGWLGVEVLSVYNSEVPYSLNDGALWAGRGAAALVRPAFAAARGRLRLVLAPEFAWSENRGFAMPDAHAPPIPADRNPWASPWHLSPESADLPLRFGASAFTRLHPGQSSITLLLEPVAFGLATENHWWGPGVRNALVLSTNAPGFPHLFFQSARPLHTALGEFEWRWLSGLLTESRWFDTATANDRRSIVSLAVTWRPRFEPNLTVGLARSVYSPGGSAAGALTGWFDALRDVGHPNARPWRGDSTTVPGPDQIASLFARWLFPAPRAEIWVELARAEQPRSLRDLLLAPDASLGYTLGFHWHRPGRRGRIGRVQGEFTSLGKSAALRDRPFGSFYTSRAVAQGYTERGEVLGAGIGPGASSQWLALDLFAPRWRAGAFLGRIRWEDDALYQVVRTNRGNRWCTHDVSVIGGVRGSAVRRWGTLTGVLSVARRLNLNFLNGSECPRGFHRGPALDVTNLNVELRWTRPSP